MRVVGVQHVSVNVVEKLDETRRFYAEVLGLADNTRPDIAGIAGHWFSLGDATQLHLVDATPFGPTDNHFCLFVEDLAEAEEELRARGIDTMTGAQGPVRQVWFEDPAGNVIELQQAH